MKNGPHFIWVVKIVQILNFVLVALSDETSCPGIECLLRTIAWNPFLIFTIKLIQSRRKQQKMNNKDQQK